MIRNEIRYLEKEKLVSQDRVIILRSKEKQLLGRTNIEKFASEMLDMYSPAPESLIVYIGN